jgi:hypothetical protein
MTDLFLLRQYQEHFGAVTRSQRFRIRDFSIR